MRANPIGRTGLRGRGRLGRWGPNRAVDALVTRWKRDEHGNLEVHPESGKPIMQFVAIQRTDTGEWAIPGGFPRLKEGMSQTLWREFLEEALQGQGMENGERQDILNRTAHFFNNGALLYRGYVDDPRNTDDAWLETVAYHLHDAEGDAVQQLQLKAGSDAKGVAWLDARKELDLYASHERILQMAVEAVQAHW
ncbi:unnamed protein product [Darwinula stevensoni]|uniref:Nudix hydrolase domain-containing protein n=1 Tax=Darwinula stevensoni TaxID=69355 RepID=A0A7R8XA23_9CRUS|nr:unnamed protein product [Darwinula stevensoni]CAG0885113.1 unnamed protein product [Darwinula stevensoni]